MSGDTETGTTGWHDDEVDSAGLPDKRLARRLRHRLDQMSAAPGQPVPAACGDWAATKAAYRFFGQAGVTFDRVVAPHMERTRQACRQPGEYLLIEDTTLLDYSQHGATEGLGVIGDGGGRGFELHSALVD